MLAVIAEAARRAVTLGLVGLGTIGVVVAVQHAGQAWSVVCGGSLLGLLVGSTARWSAEGDVKAREVPMFAGAGVGAYLVLIGGRTLGPLVTGIALAGLVAWWWLSGKPGRQAPEAEQADAGRSGPTTNAAGPGATDEPLDRLSTALLGQLWQELTDHAGSRRRPWVTAHAPHLPTATLRARVLDEFERRDPDGYARWMWYEAPAHPGAAFGRDGAARHRARR